MCILLCLGVDKINPDPNSTPPPRSTVVCALSSPGPFPPNRSLFATRTTFPRPPPPSPFYLIVNERRRSQKDEVSFHTHVCARTEKLRGSCMLLFARLRSSAHIGTRGWSRPTPPEPPSLPPGLKATTVTCQSSPTSIQPLRRKRQGPSPGLPAGSYGSNLVG